METEVKIAFDSKEKLLQIINEDWFADYCMDESSPVRYTPAADEIKRLFSASG